MCLSPVALLEASEGSPFCSGGSQLPSGDAVAATHVGQLGTMAAAAAAEPTHPVVGEFVWFDGPVTHELRNVGAEPFEALVVEWLAQQPGS